MKELKFDSQTDKLTRSGSTSILEKLKTALKTDGDFPVRAKVVNDLRNLVNNPNTSVEQITEVVLREPSLGTRVLHMVNSAFYQRAQPITTISGAVMQVGMRALSDLCAGLVLLQRFVPAAKKGGFFADNLKRSILTALLTSTIIKKKGDAGAAEQGYLAGTFHNMGYLLLAFYFPQVYEAAGKRALTRKHDINQSITEILGIKPLELSLAIFDALQIPQVYREVLVEAHAPFEQRQKDAPNGLLSHSLAIGAKLAELIINSRTKQDLDAGLVDLAGHSGYPLQELRGVLNTLPELFAQHCQLVELEFLTLPDFLVTVDNAEQKSLEPSSAKDSVSAGFGRYAEEMKQAIKDGEPVSSLITSAMEALVYALKYDRVLLLLLDPEHVELHGRMALGKSFHSDPKAIRRNIIQALKLNAPDAAALNQGTPQIFGDPLFDDGWPFAAIPIGSAERKRGVIYADRLNASDPNAQPLDNKAQAALTILADLLDQAATKES